MRPQLLLATFATVALLSGMSASANVQDEIRDRMSRNHAACDHGDRAACIRFGILIGEHHEREAEWRRDHPNWWWWTR
jgi:hypothetical protein